uniref:sensor histidine kinase n=1 Tax=Flavobacterium sp. TaxID=239 RepID=UPI002FDD7E31
LSYIKLYAQEYCESNNLNVTFTFPDVEMNFKIIGETRRHIFLSVKECLHNIVKHAEAKNVAIKIQKNNYINITIQDDGKGINPGNEKSLGGNGLKNIRQRMEKINAQFEIKNNNNGTSVSLKIPY